MTDDPYLYQITAPVTGFEIAGGELQGIDEDGVTTAPIIRLGLQVAGDDDIHYFTMPAAMSGRMSESLKEASDLSVLHWMTPQTKATQDQERKQQRRRTRRALAFCSAFLAVAMTIQGLVEAQSYQHVGGVVAGVFGALNFGFQLIGMLTVGWMSVSLLRALKWKPRIPIKKPKRRGAPG